MPWYLEMCPATFAVTHSSGNQGEDKIVRNSRCLSCTRWPISDNLAPKQVAPHGHDNDTAPTPCPHRNHIHNNITRCGVDVNLGCGRGVNVMLDCWCGVVVVSLWCKLVWRKVVQESYLILNITYLHYIIFLPLSQKLLTICSYARTVQHENVVLILCYQSRLPQLLVVWY